MFKSLLSTGLVLVLTVLVLAEGGPLRPNPDDEGYGYVDPIVVNWGTDLVSWLQIGNAITPFGRAASGHLGNYLYVFGEQNSNVAQAVNLTTNQWVASTVPLLGNCNWCGVQTTNAIYIVGRYSGSYGNEVQKFVPTGAGPTGTWTLMAPYPQSYCGIAAAWDGGDYIYAAGGGQASGTVNAYKYSISGNTWTAIPNLPVAMKYSGAAFVNGEFHVMGGVTTSTNHYAYLPASNTWVTKASVPTAIWFATFSVTDNFEDNGTQIFSVGGGGGYGSWPATNAVQIYDPVTNTWTQETVLPVTYGLNTGAYIGDGECISAGGYNGSSWFTNSYRGTGFPGGGIPPVHDVTIDLTPATLPIVIPPGGGSFNYNISLHNNETASVSCNVWMKITLPSGSEITVLGPATISIGASATISRDRTQNIPGGAPSGNYTFTGCVGTYPNSIWNSDSFPFSKSADDGSGSKVSDWANWGQNFDNLTCVSASNPAEFKLHNAHPNPFNASTTISFELPVSANIELAIYDVTGSLVRTLVDGWMQDGTYNVTFNADDLSTGVYFCSLRADNQVSTTKLLLIK